MSKKVYVKKLISIVATMSICLCFLLTSASATTGHNVTTKRYVFLVGEQDFGFAPYAAVVDYHIAVDYTRDYSSQTTAAKTCLVTACTKWTGEGAYMLSVQSGYSVEYSTLSGTRLATQQLYATTVAPSFYPVYDSDWYAVSYSSTDSTTSLGYSRMTAEGGGAVFVDGALLPYSYSSSYSF